MKRKLFFIIVFLMFVNCNCKALSYGGCSYSEVSKLKSFVSNINMSYDYYIYDNKAYFNLTINNIVPNIYFVDSYTGKTYNYYDTNEGEITIYNYENIKGNINFYSSLSECYGIKLGTKYYKFPQYNIYYNDPLCAENKKFSLCQKWQKVNYSYSEFKEKIDEYNKKIENDELEKESEIKYEKTILDIFVSFYTKYYYIILGGIILVCTVVMIVSSRKNKFKI